MEIEKRTQSTDSAEGASDFTGGNILKSSEIIRMVVDDLNTAIIIFSDAPCERKQPEITFSNAALKSLTGYTEGEFSRIMLQGLQGLRTDSKVALEIEAALKENLPIQRELLLYRKDGHEFWASINFIQPEGELGPWVLVLRDISARKRAEEELAGDRERLAVTLRSIGEGVVTFDTEGKIEFINREGEHISGTRSADVAGRYLTEVFSLFCEAGHDPYELPLMKVFRTGNQLHSNEDILLKRSNGEECKISYSLSPIIDKKGCVVGGVFAFSDISDRSKFEREMQKIQKMESIAMLTAGIAHDFNNILTGVMGNISLARNRCSADDPIARTLQSAESATLRAKELTQQLLSFSKGGVPIKSKASVRQLLTDAASFIFTGSVCRYEKQFPESLWQIEVDEGQISQVINNLLINATQAMPDGGTVTISAENVDMETEVTLPLPPDFYVKFSIRDEGPGISNENLSRIFDPYFTTKKNGTGLGLATSFSIIKNHNGHIEVDSEVDSGAVFTVYLPAIPSTSDEKIAVIEQKVYHGKGRILVMDDEPMIQQIAGDLLSHLGYDVDFAKEGEAAVQMYQEAFKSGDPYDALILDLTVPCGWGAMEVIECLRKENPEAQCILTSGYANNPIMKNHEEYGFCEVITKPYNIQQISWVLNAVVGSR